MVSAVRVVGVTTELARACVTVVAVVWEHEYSSLAVTTDLGLLARDPARTASQTAGLFLSLPPPEQTERFAPWRCLPPGLAQCRLSSHWCFLAPALRLRRFAGNVL